MAVDLRLGSHHLDPLGLEPVDGSRQLFVHFERFKAADVGDPGFALVPVRPQGGVVGAGHQDVQVAIDIFFCGELRQDLRLGIDDVPYPSHLVADGAALLPCQNYPALHHDRSDLQPAYG